MNVACITRTTGASVCVVLFCGGVVWCRKHHRFSSSQQTTYGGTRTGFAFPKFRVTTRPLNSGRAQSRRQDLNSTETLSPFKLSSLPRSTHRGVGAIQFRCGEPPTMTISQNHSRSPIRDWGESDLLDHLPTNQSSLLLYYAGHLLRKDQFYGARCTEVPCHERVYGRHLRTDVIGHGSFHGNDYDLSMLRWFRYKYRSFFFSSLWSL